MCKWPLAGTLAGLFFLLSAVPLAAAPLPPEPITLAASQGGGLALRSWHLSVNSAGQAEVTVTTFPQSKRREFRLTEEQMAALRDLLRETRFFELAGEYGQIVPDGGTQAITVTQGERSRSVRIHYLMNWLKEPQRLREPARALRVFDLVRGWFSDEGAPDSRPYDKKVIEAAGGG